MYVLENNRYKPPRITPTDVLIRLFVIPDMIIRLERPLMDQNYTCFVDTYFLVGDIRITDTSEKSRVKKNKRKSFRREFLAVEHTTFLFLRIEYGKSCNAHQDLSFGIAHCYRMGKHCVTSGFEVRATTPKRNGRFS